LWYSYYQWKLDKLTGLGSRKLVDIGSGLGWFGDFASGSGSFDKVLCVEPSFSGRNMTVGDTVESIEDIPSSYRDSIVHMSLVLEHILNPVEFLRSLRDTASVVMIVVPNEFNPLQRRFSGFGGNWFVHKHHVNYFTPASLRYVMNKAGYQVVFEGATFPMELFMFLRDYRKHGKFGAKAHVARLLFERVFGSLAFDLYEFLYKRFGIGREIVFIGVRKDA